MSFSVGKRHVATGHVVRRQLQRAEQLVQRQIKASGDRADILERRRPDEMFAKPHSGHQSERQHQSKRPFMIYYYSTYILRARPSRGNDLYGVPSARRVIQCAAEFESPVVIFSFSNP